jgi:hypothetical protein
MSDHLKQTTVDHFALIVKAADDTSGKPILSATASSTAKDLSSDSFALSALEIMVRDFPGKVVFADHNYAIGNIVGKVLTASLVQRGSETDLDVTIQLDTNNPAAVQIAAQCRDSIFPCVSVGVIVKAAHFIEDKASKTKTMVIDDIVVLELSIVGIGALDRAVVTAIKSAAATYVAETYATEPEPVNTDELAMAKLAVRSLLSAIRIKDGEMAEQNALMAEILEHVERIKNSPLPRKCMPEATFLAAADKYPTWLDPRIIAILARDKAD